MVPNFPRAFLQCAEANGQLRPQHQGQGSRRRAPPLRLAHGRGSVRARLVRDRRLYLAQEESDAWLLAHETERWMGVLLSSGEVEAPLHKSGRSTQADRQLGGITTRQVGQKRLEPPPLC